VGGHVILTVINFFIIAVGRTYTNKHNITRLSIYNLNPEMSSQSNYVIIMTAFYADRRHNMLTWPIQRPRQRHLGAHLMWITVSYKISWTDTLCCNSLALFKRSLKTFLFRQTFRPSSSRITRL